MTAYDISPQKFCAAVKQASHYQVNIHQLVLPPKSLSICSAVCSQTKHTEALQTERLANHMSQKPLANALPPASLKPHNLVPADAALHCSANGRAIDPPATHCTAFSALQQPSFPIRVSHQPVKQGNWTANMQHECHKCSTSQLETHLDARCQVMSPPRW